MCPLERYGLGRSYAALVGHVFDKTDQLPQAVCYECAHRLYAFRTFRKRGRRAHAVLQGLLEEHSEISAENLRKIDVTQIGLAPLLLWCSLKPVVIEPVFNDIPYSTSKSKNGEPGTEDIEVNTDYDIPEILSDKEKSPSPEPCGDILNYYESFIPGPTGEDRSPEPDKSQQNKRKPKLGKVAPKRKRLTKNGADGEEQTREDGPKKVKRARKVKTENGDEIVPPKEKATEANKVSSDTTQAVQPKKQRTRKRPGALPRTQHTAEYYDRFATVTTLTDEQLVEVFSRRQYSKQYLNSPYQCTDCYRGFSTRTCYDSHRERHDDPSQGSEMCKICKVRLKDVTKLKKHIAANHRTKFECKKCPYVCTACLQARIHEASHGEKHYPCASCNLVFKSLAMYRLHRNRTHPMLLACPVCGHTYPGQGAVNRHRNQTHGDVLVRGECKVLCECGTLFLSEEARGVHRSSHPQHADLDGNTSAIYCDFCNEMFSNLEAILTHRGTHGEASLAAEFRKCEQCGLMLSSREDYLAHYRKWHPGKKSPKFLPPYPRNTVMCEWCGKSCLNNASYNIHLIIYHNGESRFKCEICNRFRTSAHDLEEHRRTHTKEKPYQCNICKRKFSKKANFVRHARVHTDDAPFSCDICGKYYKYKYAIKYHIQYVHFKKPWPKRNQKTPESD